MTINNGRRQRRTAPTNEAAVTHGGFSEAKRYKERQLDLRRKDDKALMVWQAAIVEDLGGQKELDMLQSSLLDRLTELMIILRCMAQHCEQNDIIDKEGVLAPCLRTSYLSYVNSFRLTLQAIYERSDRRPPNTPSLKDIIEEGNKKDE